MDYIYDGSFEGLFTAIYEAYYRKQHPDRILPVGNHQQDIFSEVVEISTDFEKFKRVYNSIRTKISHESLIKIYHTYLSEFPDAGTMIHEYLRLGFKVGRKIDFYLSDDRVLQVENVSRKVSGERHRMLGLLRFHCLKSGVFYGPIEPDFNIAALLAPHFAERLPDQNWVIHDVKRRIGVFYNTADNQWMVSDFDANQYNLMTEDSVYQELWKQFFTSIAIKNRINPKLQKQHMPVRYWRYLVEKG